MSKSKTIETFYESYVLPSSNSELEQFVDKYRMDMSEQIVLSIDYAIKNDMVIVEVFQFKNSEFIITLSKDHFKENLDHIFNYCISNEKYELCSKISKLKNILENKKTNEKEKIKRTTGRNSTKPVRRKRSR